MKKNNPLLKRKSSRISRTGIFLSLILFLQAFALNSTAQNYQQIAYKKEPQGLLLFRYCKKMAGLEYIIS